MLGFIGTGHMAQAILRGLLSSERFDSAQILVFDVLSEKAAAVAKETGVRVAKDAADLTAQCDTVVLAVKPQVLPGVLEEIQPAVGSKQPLLVTIAAGKPLSFYEAALGDSIRLIRVMPNINAVVGAAVSAYCGNANATKADLAFADRFCSAFGTALCLPESQFSVFGALAGCSPAFVYLFIDAMARAGVKYGLPKAQALQISAQAVLGSAKMVLESGVHPQQLVDNVCSPGGTTIEGVLSLQKNGFEAAVADAVRAAFEKDRLL